MQKWSPSKKQRIGSKRRSVLTLPTAKSESLHTCSCLRNHLRLIRLSCTFPGPLPLICDPARNRSQTFSLILISLLRGDALSYFPYTRVPLSGVADQNPNIGQIPAVSTAIASSCGLRILDVRSTT